MKRRGPQTILCLDDKEVYKPGDPPPTGYVAWHHWAASMMRHGIRQRQCPRCKLWLFPGEACANKEFGCAALPKEPQ